MSFRARLTLVAAAAVAIAVVLSSVVGYVVVRDQLRGEVDAALEDRAVQIQELPFRRGFPRVPDPILGGAGGYFQFVRCDGAVLRPREAEVAIPVSERVSSVACGEAEPFFTDATVLGTHVRVLTFPYEPDLALQIL